jgi:branched-chain amino acid transport system substrate-binding protein
MRTRSRIVTKLAVVAALVGVSLSACGSDGSSGGGNVIVIGGSFSLTGADSTYDLPISTGLKMAVKEANDAGGVEVDGKKYTFDLKIEDAKSQPTIAVAGARKLVTQHKAKIIFGNGTSDTGTPVAKYLMGQDVIYFATNTQLETLLGTPGSERLFRQWGSATSLNKTYLPAATKALGIQKGVAAIFPNEDVSKAVISGDKPTLEAAGAPLVSQQLFQTGTTDFSPTLDRVKSSPIDGLYIGYSQSDLENLVRQAVTSGNVPLKFVTYGGSSEPGLNHKDEIDGYAWQYFTRAVESSDDPKVKAWTEAYKTAADRSDVSAIDSQGLAFYDSFKALTSAMTKSKTTTDVDKLADTLHNACYQGVRNICWDKDGRALANYDIGILNKGEVTIQTVPITPPAGSTTLP